MHQSPIKWEYEYATKKAKISLRKWHQAWRHRCTIAQRPGFLMASRVGLYRGEIINHGDKGVRVMGSADS